MFKYYHIIFLHYVVFTIPLPLIFLSQCFFVTDIQPVFNFGDFGADEGLFKGGVYGPCSLGSCGAALDEP